MKYLSLMHYFVVLDIWDRNDEIFLSQWEYIVDILDRFGMVDCKSMNTPIDSNLRKLIRLRLDQIQWTPHYTDSWLAHWFNWYIRGHTFSMQLAFWVSSWLILDTNTRLQVSIFWDISMVQLLMDSGMLPMEECYCLDILILIGVEKLSIGRELLGIVSSWVLYDFMV